MLKRTLTAGTDENALFFFQAAHSGVRVLSVPPVLRHFFSSAKVTCDGVGARAVEALESHSRYKDTPGEYLQSEGTEQSVVVVVVVLVI